MYTLILMSAVWLQSNCMCLLLQDMKVDGCGDGSWNNKRYFTCKDGHAVFIVLSKLKPDQRHRKRHSSGGGKLTVHSHLLECVQDFKGVPSSCGTSCSMDGVHRIVARILFLSVL